LILIKDSQSGRLSGVFTSRYHIGVRTSARKKISIRVIRR
jgi:hypothetical protein